MALVWTFAGRVSDRKKQALYRDVLRVPEIFLIDPSGKVVKHYDVTPDKLDGDSKEVLADIDSMKAAKKG